MTMSLIVTARDLIIMFAEDILNYVSVMKRKENTYEMKCLITWMSGFKNVIVYQQILKIKYTRNSKNNVCGCGMCVAVK